jgi:hypothetical protein
MGLLINNMLPIAIPLLAVSDRQDLYSMSYVCGIIAACGFNMSELKLDRKSSDVQIELEEEDGFEPTYPRLLVQVKCTYAHSPNKDNCIHFPLPLRNYNHLRQGKEPKILVVVLVPRPDIKPVEPWVEWQNEQTIFRHRAYWTNLMGYQAVPNTDNVTVKVPLSQPFDMNAVTYLMNNMVVFGNKNL